MKTNKTVRINITIPFDLLWEYKNYCKECGFNLSTRLTNLMRKDISVLKEIQRIEKRISGFKPSGFASGMLLHGLKSELDSLKKEKIRKTLRKK